MSAVSTAPSRWERFKQSDFLYYFLRDKVAMSSFAVFLLFVIVAISSPSIAQPTRIISLRLILWMRSFHPHGWKAAMNILG